jgi:NAD-dependent dihydropyrimidine dehydrogenase PreA subunit
MKTSSRIKQDPTRLIRRLTQFAFGTFIIVASVRHNLSAEHLPSTDAYCPMGGLETLWQLITKGTYVSKTHPSNIVLGLGLLIGTVIAGGAFCGWVCPFGAVQDLLAWVRRVLRLPEIKLPTTADRVLSYGRYLILIGILVATISSTKMWFADFDPYRTLFSLGWLFEFDWAEHWPAYVVTATVLTGSLLIPRFWCRYLCPLGGVLSLIQRISPIKVRRNPDVCIDCGRCDRACPIELPVSTPCSVSGDCIDCLECISSCPVPGALEVGAGRIRPNLKSEEMA